MRKPFRGGSGRARLAMNRMLFRRSGNDTHMHLARKGETALGENAESRTNHERIMRLPGDLCQKGGRDR